MFVYSEKIIQFVEDIKATIKKIITYEVGLKYTVSRFYNKKQTSSYPVKVIIFNNKSMLGYFDSQFFEMGFHECLMHSSAQQLHNIIRHELAHYLAFIECGALIQHHGPEFKAICHRLGWNEEVFRATTCLDDGNITTNIEENSVLRKVQKLLALTSSSNANEAEQAMIKSQQLLLKHNMESKYIASFNEEKVFLKRILFQKRVNAKLHAISNILQTFFVNVVFSKIKDSICIEILGEAVNIEIAEYVANFLEDELEKLWSHAKKLSNLKGMVAKNSFFHGLAKGYCNKIQALKRSYSTEETKSLMVLEKQLIDAKDLVYPRLTSMKSRGNYCAESAALGEIMGKSININSAVTNGTNKSQAAIPFFR